MLEEERTVTQRIYRKAEKRLSWSDATFGEASPPDHSRKLSIEMGFLNEIQYTTASLHRHTATLQSL